MASSMFNRHHPYKRDEGDRKGAGAVGGAATSSSLAGIRRDFDSFLYEDEGSFLHNNSILGQAGALSSETSFSQAIHPAGSAMDIEAKQQDILLKKLKARVRTLEAEIVSFRTQVLQSEQEITSLRTQLEEGHIEKEKEMNALSLENSHLKSRITDLERQRRFLGEREESTRAELKETQAELDSTRESLAERIKTLESEKRGLQLELERVRRDIGNTSLDTSRKFLGVQELVRQADLDAARAEAAQYKKRLEDAIGKIELLGDVERRALLAERQNADLVRKLQAVEENGALSGKAEHSAATDRRLRALEREAHALREAAQSAPVLREQVMQLTEQLQRAQERAAMLAPLEVELASVRERLRVWEDGIVQRNGIAGIHSPQELARFVADQQQQCVLSLEQVGAARTEAKRLEARCADALAKLDEATRKGQASAARAKRLEEELGASQARLRFAERDQESMRSVLESFHSEVRAHGSDVSRALQTQNAKQQALIEELRERVSQLEDELGRLQEDAAAATAAAVAAAQQQQQQQQQQHGAEGGAARMDEGADCNEEPSVMHDPRTTKVLTLRSNPVAWAVAERARELEALRTECAALRVRTKQLDALQGVAGQGVSEGGAAAAIGSVDPALAKELEDTKQKLEKAEKKNQRLKETMNGQIMQFRTTCYELLGYQIDVMGGNQVSLKSMYAERAEDSILFLSSPSGMQLLETPFSLTQRENIEGYLMKYHSVPAFLANLTMELFSKQTMLQ